MADLLAHQTVVHRWATGHVSGGDPEAVPGKTHVLATRLGRVPTALEVDGQWTLRIHERVETEHGAITVDDGDAVFSGTALQMYLGLWNRGWDVVARGRRQLLTAWTLGHRVRWS